MMKWTKKTSLLIIRRCSSVRKKNALIKIKQEMIIRDDEGTKREKDGRMGKL